MPSPLVLFLSDELVEQPLQPESQPTTWLLCLRFACPNAVLMQLAVVAAVARLLALPVLFSGPEQPRSLSSLFLLATSGSQLSSTIRSVVVAVAAAVVVPMVRQPMADFWVAPVALMPLQLLVGLEPVLELELVLQLVALAAAEELLVDDAVVRQPSLPPCGSVLPLDGYVLPLPVVVAFLPPSFVFPLPVVASLPSAASQVRSFSSFPPLAVALQLLGASVPYASALLPVPVKD